MKEVTSVLEFANAAAIERINYELVKVIENIQNPNTDEKPRKLTVELCLTPVNIRAKERACREHATQDRAGA